MKSWLIAIAVSVASLATYANEIVTQAKTLLPVGIPVGKEVRAMFDGLRPDALQLGLGEAVIIGTTKYETSPDKTTRVYVDWHSIGMTSNQATRTLKVPLNSQFRTPETSLPPNTLLAVRGQFDALLEDFDALKQGLKKETPRDLVKQANNNNTETTAGAGADALQPSGSGSGFKPSNAGDSWTNNNDSVKTDLITTEWQACQPRVDRPAGKVYAQARRIEITESGRVMSTGSCEDHGSVAVIQREYGKACEAVVDVAARKVYDQYRELAMIENKEFEISLCAVDFAKFTEIVGNPDACGYRHDFNAGKSFRQETLYYNNASGKMIEVRACGDSDKAFSHFTTQNTCAPTIDMVNREVFMNIRTAFSDENGAERYATDCRPDGNPSFAVTEEFCSPKYEHDFINNVSYYSTRPYYVSGRGDVVYVGTCARSPSASFAHRKNTASCANRHDDANLKSYFSEKKEIDTPDGVFEIAPCQESQAAVPYAYLGQITQSDVIAIDSFIVTSPTSLASLLGINGNDPKWGMKATTAPQTCFVGAGDIYAVNPPSNLVSSFVNTITWSGQTMNMTQQHANGAGFRVRVWKQPTAQRYMRSDGSYYDVALGGNFYTQVACQGAWQ